MASILDDISSVNMLESLITRDSRWEWILDEWESSDDEQLLGVAATVRRFLASMGQSAQKIQRCQGVQTISWPKRA